MERRRKDFLLGSFVKLQSGHRPYKFFKGFHRETLIIKSYGGFKK